MMLFLSAPPCEKQPGPNKTSTILEISLPKAHNSKLNLPCKLSEKFPKYFSGFAFACMPDKFQSQPQSSERILRVESQVQLLSAEPKVQELVSRHRWVRMTFQNRRAMPPCTSLEFTS